MTAKAKQEAAQESYNATQNEPDVSAPEGLEWKTIAEEGALTVVFDKIGDQFVGRYVGVEHIEPDNGKDEAFDRFTFRAKDKNLYAVNQSYKLADALEDVAPGTWVRITYVKDIPTKRALNPMKDFVVDVATN